MSKAYHIAQSGKNKGKLVPCYAKNCRNNIHTVEKTVVEPVIPNVPNITDLPPLTRENIANQTSKPHVLNQLALDTDENVRYAVASNKHIPLQAQLVLADDNDFDIVSALALNSNLDSETFTKLAENDKEFYGHIYYKLLENRNTTAEALNIIFPKTSWKERIGLASHINADADLLNKLTEAEISDTVEFNDLRYLVAKHKNTNSETLDRIVETCEDQDTLKRVAVHRKLSPESVLKLSNSTDKNVRKEIAARKDLPEDTLLGLLIDADITVRTAAYYNPKTGEDFKPAAILAGGIIRRSETIY